LLYFLLFAGPVILQ